jgi:hypothetical protein
MLLDLGSGFEVKRTQSDLSGQNQERNEAQEVNKQQAVVVATLLGEGQQSGQDGRGEVTG